MYRAVDVTACETKKRFTNKRTALACARRARKRTGHAIYAYFCDAHDAFHIGHLRERSLLKEMKG